ncbi:hypothetical protein [Streptomyces sp. AC550_RSS872]|uniref:hypothetical protein n=1 Tax=Streptomyces sp. AC550_RSS872 TaxID=2823689 RepID=UPI001C2656D4|nr:hypothetical protein [Streptomyces sp. AC550_RSS872]
MATADVLASHRSGDKLRTAARTLVVAVRQASCLWVPWPRRAAGHLGDVTSTRCARSYCRSM